MPTDHRVRRDAGRRKRRTALQTRIEYESAHPEIAIMAPLTSRSGQWEVSTADGTSRFSEVWAMLDFLASLFGPLECERHGGQELPGAASSVHLPGRRLRLGRIVEGSTCAVALRVLVDATDVPTDRGALGRYVDGLIGALGGTGVDLAVACQLGDEDRYGRLAPGAAIVAGPVGLGHRSERLAWEQNGLPLVAEQVGADVLHMPYYSMPLRPGLPTVVTIHDLAFFTDPERYTPVSGMSLKSATKTAARQATRLIVPSNATRDELIRVLGIDSGRIDVAYHGVDHRLFHRPDQAQISHVTARLGLRGRPYVAFLGSLAPRKNAPSLVSGWAAAVADMEDPPALVLGGGGGWSEELDAAVARLPSHLRLVRPGYLPFADLPGFLGGALAVVAPSRGEGFGLQVLEAMACGAPVLTTYRASLPEVGGDAVAYTEPDADAIAVALRALLDDPQRRNAVAEAGYIRAQAFTWAASAAAHVASYKRAADQTAGAQA